MKQTVLPPQNGKVHVYTRLRGDSEETQRRGEETQRRGEETQRRGEER